MYRLLILLALINPLVGVKVAAELEFMPGFLPYNKTAEVICNVCECWERRGLGVLKIDCSSRNLTELSYIKNPPLRVIELDLSDNGLQEVPNLTHVNYSSLLLLKLNRNNITRLNESIIFKDMLGLYLDNNGLKSIDGKLLPKLESTPFKLLSLHDNPWTCDCDNNTIDFAEFVQNNAMRILNTNTVICQGSKVKVVELQTEMLCENISDTYALYFYNLMGLILVASILGVALSVYHNHKHDGTPPCEGEPGPIQEIA